METLEKNLRKYISNPKKYADSIYAAMDGLGLKYTRTSCAKCLRDYINICLEEIGAIKDASKESEFNNENKTE